MRYLEVSLHPEREVRLTALLQGAGGEFAGMPPRPAVLVLPGGGYQICSDREDDPVTLYFAGRGYHVFSLRYTLNTTAGGPLWPHPLEDYDEAFDLIRTHAGDWSVDPERIAVCGFSAGGHLAACAATVARNRPAAAILGYPAILGDLCDFCAPGLPRPAEEVDGQTPPCFLMAARDDDVVSVKNALAFAEALTDQGILYELHLYTYGGHGFATGAEWLNGRPVSRGAARWMEDASRFLEEVFGRMTVHGMTAPEVTRLVGKDYAPFLSIDCTLAHLENQPGKAQALLGKLLARISAALLAREGELRAPTLKTMVTLRQALDTMGMEQETVTRLEAALTAIPNIR